MVPQKSLAPVRKLKYGGCVAVLAIVLTAILNRVVGIDLPPAVAELMSTEILMSFGAAIVWGAAYYTRARAREE